jgi:GAF domain-containing protein
MHLVVQAQSQGPAPDPTVGLLILLLALALGVIGYLVWQQRRARALVQARLDELGRLGALGRGLLSAQLDSRRLAEFIYREAGQIVDTTFFQVGVFEGDRYRMLIWVQDNQVRQPMTVRLTPDALGIVGWLRESRQPLLIRDFEAEQNTLPARPRYLSPDPPHSAVFVPLFAGERVIGAMAIQSRRRAAFSEEHLRLLTIIANTAAAALENARLFEQTERRAAQLQLLAQVSRRINVLQPLPAFYRQVVELISEQFSEYLVSVFILEGHTLRLVASTRADWRGQPLEFSLDAGPVGQAARTRRLVVVEPPLPVEEVIVQPPGGLAEIAAPLLIEDRVLGVLCVQGQGAAFDEAAVSLFESLAAQIAFATLEAQVYAREQQRAEQLAVLAQASRSVVSNLELDAILEDVIELVEERFGYNRARIFLLQDNRLQYRAGSEAWEARWSRQPLSYDLNGPGLIARVGRTQQPVLADDVHTQPDYVPGPGLGDTRAEMAVPLVMAGRLLGVFDVQSDKPAAFTADDLQTLQALADTLAIALRNARLFEIERRRRRFAEALREVANALTTTLALKDELELILGGLAHVVVHDVASILLVDEYGELTLRAVGGPKSAPLQEALGEPVPLPLFPRGEAPASVDLGASGAALAYHARLGLSGPPACLGAPLVVEGEHLGYLVVSRAGAAGFPPEDVEFISAFAAQASVALENARLFNAQREQAWVSTALLQVAEAIAQTPELEDALATVAHITPMLVGVHWCAVFLAEADVFYLHAFHHARGGAVPDPEAGISLREWPRLNEMVTQGEPVVIEPGEPAPEPLQMVLTGLALLLPLWSKGQIQGALLVGQGGAPEEGGGEEAPLEEFAFTPNRIRLLGGIANQAALALESAQLDQARQEEAWVSAALLQVAEAVAGQPTLEESLETVARLTPMLVGVERVAIYRWLPEQEVFRPARCVGFTCDTAELTATVAELDVDPLTPTTQSHLVYALPERLVRGFGVNLVRVWPLWARGELFGALVVEHAGELGRRLNILNGIAHQLSMAMESERLAREVAQQQRLEREMELGRDIQASFLPRELPQPPGWETAAAYQSARLVGGDFYDFISLKTADGVERWGLAIADVSDKGVPAALFMALSRTLLRSAALHRTSPGATLTRVNEMILADARSSQFVTVFYAIWEPGTGRLVYANAGHNPPVLMRANGEAQLLKLKGAVLAVFAEYYYHQAEAVMEPGDVLLLYSDGLTDALNENGEEFGLPRIIETLRAARAQSAGNIISALEAAVQHHVRDVEPFDDLTMVVVKRAEQRGG